MFQLPADVFRGAFFFAPRNIFARASTVVHCTPLYVHFRLIARLLLSVTRPCASICRHFPSPRALSLLANRRRPRNLLSFSVPCYRSCSAPYFSSFCCSRFFSSLLPTSLCCISLHSPCLALTRAPRPHVLPTVYNFRRPLLPIRRVVRSLLPVFLLFLPRVWRFALGNLCFSPRLCTIFYLCLYFFVKHLTFSGGGIIENIAKRGGVFAMPRTAKSK